MIRSQSLKLTQCSCWQIFSCLLTNSTSHLDWGWLRMGLDFLFMETRKTLSTTLSLLPTKRPLFQVRFRQFVTFDVSPAFQFTICSSATSDAFLTGLFFFQLLRQSGNPWITLSMRAVPGPGKEDAIFRLTVLSPPESRFISETQKLNWLKSFEQEYTKILGMLRVAEVGWLSVNTTESLSSFGERTFASFWLQSCWCCWRTLNLPCQCRVYSSQKASWLSLKVLRKRPESRLTFVESPLKVHKSWL